MDLQTSIQNVVAGPSRAQDLSKSGIYFNIQNGESAVIIATVKHQPHILRELVRAGSDLNLQYQVNYSVTVGTRLICVLCTYM